MFRPTVRFTNIKMYVTLIAFVLSLGTLQSCAAYRQVILNEADIYGSCKSTCEDIGELFDRNGCAMISDCVLNTKGFRRGLVRCDFCSCACEEDLANRDITVVNKSRNFEEEDLYGQCSGTCDYTSGLLRTDYGGCQEVRDCRLGSKGNYVLGLARCDHCICDCVSRKRAVSYELINVEYDFSVLVLNDGQPAALSQIVLENKDPNRDQTATATVDINYSKTETMETTRSLELGLSVTVSAGFAISGAYAGIDIGGDVGTEITTSLTTGWTYTAGTSTTNARSYSATPTITVPAASTTTAIISGSVMKIDIPYTADLVKTYEDGTKSSATPISGIYSNVETGRFTITYEEPIAAGICQQQGWEAFNGSCFILDDSADITYDEANAECSSKKSMLASVHSADEQMFLEQMMKKDVDYAIGLTSDRVAENMFVWLDGSKLDYTNWGDGLPVNISNNNQDCVGIRSTDRKWDVFPCSTLFTGFICQQKSENAEDTSGLSMSVTVAIVVMVSLVLIIIGIISCRYFCRYRSISGYGSV